MQRLILLYLIISITFPTNGFAEQWTYDVDKQHSVLADGDRIIKWCEVAGPGVHFATLDSARRKGYVACGKVATVDSAKGKDYAACGKLMTQSACPDSANGMQTVDRKGMSAAERREFAKALQSLRSNKVRVFHNSYNSYSRSSEVVKTRVRAFKRPHGVFVSRGGGSFMISVRVVAKNVGTSYAQNVRVNVKVPGGAYVELRGPQTLAPRQESVYVWSARSVYPLVTKGCAAGQVNGEFPVPISKSGLLRAKLSCQNCWH